MGIGGFDLAQMKKLQQKLNKLNEDEINAFCEECAKELAARLLRKVIKRTPAGQYPKSSGKKGGTLRRGWTDAMQHIEIQHTGDTYVIEIINPVEYASYVEYGHRTANHNGWVKGQFCMTISEQEMQTIAPKLFESRIKKFLGGCIPMINTIVGAISSALFEEFGYENHMEEIKQGLVEPCFFISCLNPDFRRYMGNRYFRQNKFCIQYFPQSKDAANRECYSVAERMNFCLEVIQVLNKSIRGTEMRFEVVDGILNYFVNYDCFVYKVENADSMGSMSSNTNVKG